MDTKLDEMLTQLERLPPLKPHNIFPFTRLMATKFGRVLMRGGYETEFVLLVNKPAKTVWWEGVKKKFDIDSMY